MKRWISGKNRLARWMAPWGRGVVAFSVLSAFFALGAGISTARAEASASPWATTDQSGVRLVAAVTGADNADRLQFGLQFRLKPGWKVYWRTPGDAGVAPRFDWAGSRNLDHATVGWPAPERFNLYGLESFGYLGEVVLPVAVVPRQPGQAVHLRLVLSYGICREVCIPYQASLSLDLPAGPAAPAAFAPLIAHYAAQVPPRGPQPGFAIDSARYGLADGTLTLLVTARATPAFSAPDLLVEGPDGVGFGKSKVSFSEEGHRISLTTPVEGAAKDTVLDGRPVTLTLIDGTRAVEQSFTLAPMVPSGSLTEHSGGN